MTRRRSAIAVLALLPTATTAIPTGAYGDDGEGNVMPPSAETQQHELENATGGRADANSNRPKTHAPCEDGMAADTYPCHKVAMLSHLTLDDLGLSFATDIWGWTDPLTKSDYAIVGGVEGTVFVDISKPKRPNVVGILPGATTDSRSAFRDIKVYANHAFVGSESDDHGLQVFDLTRLRGDTGDRLPGEDRRPPPRRRAPIEFDHDARYTEFSTSHNLAVNEDTGFLYVLGSDTCGGGLHMVDISDPVAPSFVGCFSDHDYIHDTQCVVYEGPDTDYRGREICFNSAADNNSEPGPMANTVSIVDVTDKSSPTSISRMPYENSEYSHQGWLTPDQAYFLHNDEGDEFTGAVDSTTTRIWDVADLDEPVLVAAVGHGTPSTDHNLYTEGRYVYESNYNAGLRIFDTSKLADGMMDEVAYFDVHPENDGEDGAPVSGTWSNYPFFRQKKIVAVSSMDRGLFILRLQIGGG